MALDCLAQGRLVRAPERRTTKSGKPYATAQLAVATGGDESALLSLIAFRSEVVDALAALDRGDSICVTGRATPKAWSNKSTGEPCAGLSIVVELLLSPYHLNRKRAAAQSDDREPQAPTPPRRRDRAPAARVASRRTVADAGDGIDGLAGDEPDWLGA